MISGSLSDRENYDSRGPCYFMVKMINTSVSTIDIGRNVKIGEGEPLELGEAEVVTEENLADYRQFDVNKEGKNDAEETNRVYHVSETDNEVSVPPFRGQNA